MTSISRYVLVAFPAFIALACGLRSKAVYLGWLAFSLASQVILLFFFYRWIWVA